MSYQKILCCIFALLGSYCAVAQSYNATFDKGDDGWIGSSIGFAPKDHANYNISIHWDTFDNEITNGERGGLLFKGINLNGQVFLYAFRHFTGLKPNSVYKIVFNCTIFNFPTATSEKGTIYVKAGGLPKMPASLYMYKVECNFNKGKTGMDGKDLVILDSIQVGANSARNVVHNYLKPFEFKTNSKGEIYLMIGFEPSKNLTFFPNIFLSFIRATFNYEHPLSEEEQTRRPINLYSLPNYDGFYFDTELEADLSSVSIYSINGHLIKVIELSNPFHDHIVKTSDLSPGLYQVVFSLVNGKRYTREIHILP